MRYGAILAFALLLGACGPVERGAEHTPATHPTSSGPLGFVEATPRTSVPQRDGSDRRVIITNQSGRPLAGATVYVETPSLTYTYTTAANGSVDLPETFLQEPKWIEVVKAGFVPIRELAFPRAFPQVLKLRASAAEKEKEPT